jgi:glycosyltransferase involved in cell wall biosynthesis
MGNIQRNQSAKVCHLSSAHFVSDSRIFYKEVKTLANDGYSVTLIAMQDKVEIIDGVKIVPLPVGRNRFQRMIWGQLSLLRLALKERADIYHFHDPDIIPIGLVLKLFGKKVIYDVHEDFPKQILSKEWIGGKLLRKTISKLFTLLEKFSARMYDGIVAATPDISRNFPVNKTVTVMNFPVLETIDKAQPIVQVSDKPVVLYAGALSRVRGTKEIIQAMEYIGDKAELHLLGEWQGDTYQQECMATKGYEYTKYIGYLPLSEVYAHMKAAYIGVSILYPIKNYLTSLPVKAYEYMFCGLAMVMSDFPLWKEMFGRCALFANPYAPKDIADRIKYLLDNPEETKKLGAIGKELVIREYNWRTEGEKITCFYTKILHGK